MTTTKMNIELAISRNYDKVSLSFLDEPLQHESEEELKAEIRQRFKLLREEINKEFEAIQ